MHCHSSLQPYNTCQMQEQKSGQRKKMKKGLRGTTERQALGGWWVNCSDCHNSSKVCVLFAVRCLFVLLFAFFINVGAGASRRDREKWEEEIKGRMMVKGG